MSKHNQQLGQHGETLAVNFLQQLHYQILERNFRTKYGEIDIIAQKDFEIIFFEVKTRNSRMFGRPSEIINATKLKRMEKCAWVYLSSIGIEYSDWSIKIIEVYKDNLELIEVIV